MIVIFSKNALLCMWSGLRLLAPTVYTNLHTKIFLLKHGKFEKTRLHHCKTFHLTYYFILKQLKLENFAKTQTFLVQNGRKCFDA